MNWIPIEQFDPSLDGEDFIGNEWLLSDGKSIVIGRASYQLGDDLEFMLTGFSFDDCSSIKPTHFAPLPELPIAD